MGTRCYVRGGVHAGVRGDGWWRVLGQNWDWIKCRILFDGTEACLIEPIVEVNYAIVIHHAKTCYRDSSRINLLS
jgi:hypothetical protein